MFKNIFLITCSILLTVKAFNQPHIYNILDYGAVADSNTINTKAIQKAIDDASAK